MSLLPFCLSGQDNTNQFLFLRMRLKGQEISLVESSVVKGVLKPQRDSEQTERLVVALESDSEETQWSLTIADPGVRRLEYEDPEKPGTIRSKLVRIEDVEIVVRAPQLPGVRKVAVYRKENGNQLGKGKKLLARVTLPPQTIK
jgi:hypothetical protein